jgi:hypothetical protein
VPVRLVVLDTVAPNPPPTLPHEFGVMTVEQFNGFLKPQIAAARAASEYVIVVSHHPSVDFDRFYPGFTVDTSAFRTYLASCPNVLAHISGHFHWNAARIVDGPYPYIEVETASLVDSPQEARIFDVFYVPETQSFRIESWTVSHIENPTRLSAESYRRAENDVPGLLVKGPAHTPGLTQVFAEHAAVQGLPFDEAGFDAWTRTPAVTKSPESTHGAVFSIVLPGRAASAG